jgi:two-component system KDP operon response regulator KdpE
VKVIVIEDAEETAESIRLGLSARWPECTILCTSNAETGARLVEAESPDAVILDLALVDGTAVEVLKEIRSFSNVPVLIVSAHADELGRVLGLEYGADDFMVKPFSPTELLARIRAVLRRTRRAEPWKDEGVIRAGRITLDADAGRAYVDGIEREFTATEWKLLSYLVRHAGKVIPPQALALNVWGMNHVEAATIKMCIRRLRKKLGEDTQSPRLIRSHRGRGYSLEGARQVSGGFQPAAPAAPAPPPAPASSFSNCAGGTGGLNR